MPRKGYKPTKAHRARLAKRKREYWQRVQPILIELKQRRPNRKFVHTTNPISTPIPPSASHIKSLPLQRWAVYSYNADGHYFYKREQADTFKLLQQAIADAELTPPLWTYVKSGHTEADIALMPIRIAEDAIRGLGHRFQKMRRKE